MKPIIGITQSITSENIFTINKYYSDAIYLNGGIPMFLAYNDIKYVDDILPKIDGLLLSGGGDIDPKNFGQTLHEKSDLVLPIRDEFEMYLCKQAIDKNIPILGICRGMQLLNVVLNGDLNQHIENHQFADKRNEYIHEVIIKENSLLFHVLKRDNLLVNSIHHQSVANTNDDILISAVANDGTIEAIEFTKNKFVLGVQWHPEALRHMSSSNDKLFKAFVDACK